MEKMFEFGLDIFERMLYYLDRTFVPSEEAQRPETIIGQFSCYNQPDLKKRRDLYADYLYYQLPPWGAGEYR